MKSIFTAFATAITFSILLQLCLLVQLTRAQIEMDAILEEPLRPSESETAKITIGVIESLFLTQHENATDCKLALEDSID